ncbi:MAG: N-6 DNA methylase [Bacilli bacterium]|nr:N-6 DNA methylase [Bacilli bacterium]
MKYNITPLTIPHDRRKEINDKCLYIIDNNLNSLTQQDIFSAYTGEGGLHGLEFSKYNSFHDYTEAKKEIEQGQFFTPHSICQFIVNCIKPNNSDIICDMTCGSGNFFNFLPVERNIYGNELDIKAYKIAKYLYPDASISAEDIRYYNPGTKFDIILGNPPFSLKWSIGKDEYLSQLYYCIKSSELLKPAGFMVLIVPNSFLNDDFSDAGMIKEINNRFNFICQFDLPSNSFQSLGVINFKTKVMFFQKQSEHLEIKPYSLDKIDMIGRDADYIYSTYLKPYINQKEKVKSKLYFENIHNNEQDFEFQYKVKKLLFDIKRHPICKEYYGKCLDYLYKYNNQKKPEEMKWEEWDKVKITQNKVISYLTKYLKKQSEIEKDEIKLVKTNHALKLKAYSRKTKLQLSKMSITKRATFNDMIIQDIYPFEDQTYCKLLNKKINQYKKQTQPYNDMDLDNNIQSFLNNLVINDSLNDKEIRLNDIQKEDTNKTLQKDYGFLQWERGTGKTITGTAQALYRLKNNDINNVIVIAPSIAIKGTWDECMESYGIDYILISKLNDLKKIKKGQIVLMTLYVVNKYRKQIKKMLKMNNKKYFLIFDESDAITNLNSQTYKAVLNCFRKLVKYKLLLTGTSTRNNINEFFGQLELLYNNSVNMLSKSSTIYVEDKKTKEINQERNPYFYEPFPPYKEGYNQFKRSFSPERITVFGIGKLNQDIYNSEDLKELLSYTVITRTFKEITGREGYKPHQELCNFNEYEKAVYNVIIEKFYEIEREYFKSTGNYRKDAMFRALHQLNLLLQACARFHTFKQYEGNDISTKFKAIIRKIKGLEGQRIAIGCVTKKSVWEYQRQLKKHFPERNIIAFTGENTNIYQRKAVIKELQKDKSAILITTQQSLSCSLNIGFIDHIFIPELQFNDARMGQYYFRFIRYDSTEDKNVYIFTYKNSIESNLMKLVMVKEKINLFMKGEELTDDELNEKYGIDFDLLDMLLSKEIDEEGKSYIRWGEQVII